MAWRSLYNEIRVLKLKEVPDYLKPKLTVANMKKSIERGLDSYNEKYIQTSSVDPLLHVCFGGMALSYLLALPEERRHLAHKEQGHH